MRSILQGECRSIGCHRLTVGGSDAEDPRCSPARSATRSSRQRIAAVTTSSAPPLSFSAGLRLPLVERWLQEAAPASVLEAGCGAGAMGYRLATRYEYRGYEPDSVSFSLAEERLASMPGAEVVNSTVPSHPDRLFDLVVAFEVLEHIEDDVSALHSWLQWIREGGWAILSVPAHPARYGACDVAVGHYRRYTKDQLAGVMESAGLEVIDIQSWGMPFGYLLEAVRHLLARRNPDMHVGTTGSGRLLQPPASLKPYMEFVSRPAAAIQRPFVGTDLGIGYVAAGRKSPHA